MMRDGLTPCSCDNELRGLWQDIILDSSSPSIPLLRLRQSTSPAFQSSVRAALDSMMADEGSRPFATHLKQAWDSDTEAEKLKVFLNEVSSVSEKELTVTASAFLTRGTSRFCA